MTLMLFAIVFSAGCTPTVQVAAPKEPIEINLNVKIEHEIRVQVDEELEGLFDEDSDVF
ncbi:MAG: YnbE family lipoprotein [Woeseiaceae bacterium]|nr:YnbE family lipoprotein [Woeseiaceae bacterium]